MPDTVVEEQPRRRRAESATQTQAQRSKYSTLPSSTLTSPLSSTDTAGAPTSSQVSHTSKVSLASPSSASPYPSTIGVRPAPRNSEPARPGTASTVSSYTSARFFSDDASPTQRTVQLPTIASRSALQQSSSYELVPASPGGSLRSLDSSSKSIASASSSGGLTTKRNILMSAASASRDHTARDDDDGLSATSSRRTVLANGGDDGSGGADSALLLGIGSPSTSTRALGARPTSSSSRSSSSSVAKAERSRLASTSPQSPSKSKRRPTRLLERNLSSSTHGSAQYATPPSGGASPVTPTASLPVHPLHRPKSNSTNGHTSEGDQSLGNVSASKVDVESERDGARTPLGRDTAPIALTQSNKTEGLNVLDEADGHEQAVSNQQVQPQKGSKDSDGHVAKDDSSQTSNATPKPRSTAVFASPSHESTSVTPDITDISNRTPKLADQSQASERQSGGALRERLRKTGGFLRRLGSGTSSNSSSSTSAQHADKASAETKTKASAVPLRKSVLRKASQNSFVTDDEGDEKTQWTSQQTVVPVPSIPAQYRDQVLPSESSKSTLKGLTPSRSPTSADRLNGTTTMTSSASPSMEFDKSLRAWEKEMDAELDKTAQNLDEITKIQAPRPNWTPSPQLPDYRRVLNRKGSFMDEGEETNNGTTNGRHDSTASSRADGSQSRASLSAAPIRRASVQHMREPESLSYESHFLAPTGYRSSNTHSESCGATTPPAPFQMSVMTEPLKSTARFAPRASSPNENEDDEEFLRTRDDNMSTATVRSFQTAVDRQSVFLRHARQEKEGDRSKAIVLAESRNDLADNVTSAAVNESPLPSPAIAPELSVRLVTAKQNDTSDDFQADHTHGDDIQSPLSALTLQHHSTSVIPGAGPAVVATDHAGATKPGDVLHDDEAKAKELAEKCWKEDETFKRREKIAEWLGGHGTINRRSRAFYFSHFDFSGLSVDGALRKLCDKLFLRAETQQVDRILSAFSLRYFACNPTTQLGSADVVHALTFSILLLNTDLHVADLTERMTRTQFVRNTIEAIIESDNGELSSITKSDSGKSAWEVHMEMVLRDIYNSVKNDRIRLPLSDADRVASSAVSSSALGSRTLRANGVNALKRGSIRGFQGLMASGATAGGRVRSNETSALDGGDNEKRDGASTSDTFGRASTSSWSSSSTSAAVTPQARLAAPTMGFANTLSKSIIKEAQNEQDQDDSTSMDSFKEELTDEELALVGPPWAKEGMLTRKHYWESASKRAKDKSWLECFTVIQKGQLSMFKFGTSSSNGTVKQNSPALGGGNWLANATCIGQFTLAHSLTNILPSPGYNRARPHVFALTLLTGSVYFFQTAHEDLAQEWTATCNYWAARLSKEPLAAGVSNMEYGWNRVQALGDSLSTGGGHTMDSIPASNSRRSLADSLSEEEHISRPTFTDSHVSSMPPPPPTPQQQQRKNSDTRSVRSGRSARSTRSSRLRSNTATLLQNWSSGNSLDRIINANATTVASGSGMGGNQSTTSSPVTSVVSLSTPGTSITTTFDRPMVVHEWRPPVAPTMPSSLSEEEQLDACIRHTMRIERELEHHNSLRQPMLHMFNARAVGRGFGTGGKGGNASMMSLSPPKSSAALSTPYGSGGSGGSAAASTATFGSGGGSSNSHPTSTAMTNKAFSNWERRSAYLLSELTKFQLYVDSLRSASRARAEKTDERALNRMMRRADEDLRSLGPAAGVAGNTL